MAHYYWYCTYLEQDEVFDVNFRPPNLTPRTFSIIRKTPVMVDSRHGSVAVALPVPGLYVSAEQVRGQRRPSWLSGVTDSLIVGSIYEEKQELLFSRGLGISHNLRRNTLIRGSRGKGVNLSDCGKLKRQGPHSGQKVHATANSPPEDG